MTKTAIHLTRSVNQQVIKKLFEKFSIRYGAIWTSRLGPTGCWKDCEDDWLEELSQFSFAHIKIAVKRALAIHVEFPPTLGQLVQYCLKESGTPDVSDVIKLMVSRKFNHPVVKMVYDKLGSWLLANGTASDVQAKAKAVYADCLANFIIDPELHWSKLNDHRDTLALAPSKHPKIASTLKISGFKERMDEFKMLAEEGAVRLKDMKPIEFDEKRIGKEGDQRADYEKYLLSVPENLVLGLSSKYAYDRQRLLNKNDTARYLRECGYIPIERRNVVDNARSGNNKPTKMYKNWGD
jgi:hypothetical protein